MRCVNGIFFIETGLVCAHYWLRITSRPKHSLISKMCSDPVQGKGYVFKKSLKKKTMT